MESNYPDPEQVMQSLGPAAVFVIAAMVLMLSLIVVIIKAVIYCKVFSKAGYHWALGLLALIPILNIIMPFVLAFGQWPIRMELEELRRQLPQRPSPSAPV
jgi:magnesium-transporting ATPase (P-type)